ncbi:metallophosphoesterase, partial [Escherichia coli]|nr:metallophosphoesterase [Escherichia coli]
RRPAALLFTGDLADDGEPADYEQVGAVLHPALARLGARLVVIPGNHDVTANLRRYLLGDTGSSGPLDSCLRLGGLRIVALDSSVEG